MGSTVRKSLFLGMPHGTAANRLRKQLLFKYVQQAGDDVCFKCGQKIESVDDLSIEHKEPWENRSVEFFWDLDNIAFSHIRCNVPHIRGKATARYIVEEGLARCSTCKQSLPVSMFTKSYVNKTGWNHRCKQCTAREAKQRRKLPD